MRACRLASLAATMDANLIAPVRARHSAGWLHTKRVSIGRARSMDGIGREMFPYGVEIVSRKSQVLHASATGVTDTVAVDAPSRRARLRTPWHPARWVWSGLLFEMGSFVIPVLSRIFAYLCRILACGFAPARHRYLLRIRTCWNELRRIQYSEVLFLYFLYPGQAQAVAPGVPGGQKQAPALRIRACSVVCACIQRVFSVYSAGGGGRDISGSCIATYRNVFVCVWWGRYGREVDTRMMGVF